MANHYDIGRIEHFGPCCYGKMLQVSFTSASYQAISYHPIMNYFPITAWIIKFYSLHHPPFSGKADTSLHPHCPTIFTQALSCLFTVPDMNVWIRIQKKKYP